MPEWLGGWEIVIIAIVVLVLFGGTKIAAAGKNAGRAIREFKAEVHADDPKQVPAPPVVPPVTPPASAAPTAESAEAPKPENGGQTPSA